MIEGAFRSLCRGVGETVIRWGEVAPGIEARLFASTEAWDGEHARGSVFFRQVFGAYTGIKPPGKSESFFRDSDATEFGANLYEEGRLIGTVLFAGGFICEGGWHTSQMAEVFMAGPKAGHALAVAFAHLCKILVEAGIDPRFECNLTPGSAMLVAACGGEVDYEAGETTFRASQVAELV